MKNWMKVFGMTAISLCLVGGTAWADTQSDAERQMVQDAFIASQDVSYQIGYFESENGKTDGLTEQQIASYLSDFNEKIDRYYAKTNACGQDYKEINEKILREVAKNKVNYVVQSGVLDCTFHSVSISEDKKTAVVKAVCKVWGDWVEENESGNIEVTAPINRNTITATMVKEDGLWKLGSIDKMDVEFADDVIEERNVSELMTQEDDEQKEAINDYIEQTHIAEYKTFSEALTVAENLDPYAINPF